MTNVLQRLSRSGLGQIGKALIHRFVVTVHQHFFERGWIRVSSLREALRSLHRLAKKDKQWLLRNKYLSSSHLRLDYLNTRKEIETTLKTQFLGSGGNACRRFFHQPADFTLNGVHYYNPVDEYWLKKRDFVMQYVEKTTPRRILDMGAADCWFETQWANLGIATVAVEGTTYHYMNGLLLRTAKGLNFDILYGDAEDLSLWEIISAYGHFDLCFMGDFIEHLDNPVVVLERIFRLCESLIVITPLCKETRVLRTREGGDHKWFFDSCGLKEMIRAVGFRGVNVWERDGMLWAIASASGHGELGL